MFGSKEGKFNPNPPFEVCFLFEVKQARLENVFTAFDVF